MCAWKIGVMVESLQLGLRRGVEKAAELGADGIQFHGTSDEMQPDRMTTEKRLEFVDFVRDQGLTITALGGDCGKGLLDAETNTWVVPETKAFVDLAVDLGTRVVTAHVGTLPRDEYSEAWRVGVQAAREIADYAANRGVIFAGETGYEAAEVLGRFLEKVGSPGFQINYDPANLVIKGFDHLSGVDVLGEHIVHTHAKDAVRHDDGTFTEVPLGKGAVDFPKYLEKLHAVGFQGFLVIEREVSDRPVEDIAWAVDFLRQFP